MMIMMMMFVVVGLCMHSTECSHITGFETRNGIAIPCLTLETVLQRRSRLASSLPFPDQPQPGHSRGCEGGLVRGLGVILSWLHRQKCYCANRSRIHPLSPGKPIEGDLPLNKAQGVEAAIHFPGVQLTMYSCGFFAEATTELMALRY